MRETKNLINLNFKLFGKFAKLFMKLEEHLNPLVGDAEKLRREYQTFCNKRPTRSMRGLEIQEKKELENPVNKDTDGSLSPSITNNSVREKSDSEEELGIDQSPAGRKDEQIMFDSKQKPNAK